MPHNYSSDLLTNVIDYLLDQDASSHRSQAMELRLTKHVLPRLDVCGRVAISQAEMTAITGVTSPTIRKFNKDMVDSGRWKIVAGGEGPTKTVYEPLFLEAVAATKKEGN